MAIAETRLAAPTLWANSIAMLILFAVCSVLSALDTRLLNGVSVWVKPAKFYFSLAVHLLTLGWAASLLSASERASPVARFAPLITMAAGWAELAVITGRAALGQASHFNQGTALDSLLYGLMGLGAVTMTASTGALGYYLWRQRNGLLLREATGIGLMLGAILATLSAGYLAQQQGHWVGGDLTDATGLPLFYWSTTGGDLRVAHFIGLHSMQAVPFAALTGRKWVVWLAAAAISLLTLGAFLQAMAGLPPFKA